MKKSLGAIISAVGALLAILGMFLPFVKIEFLGMSESWNLFTERFYVFGLITMLVAVAGAVLSFIKKYLRYLNTYKTRGTSNNIFHKD